MRMDSRNSATLNGVAKNPKSEAPMQVREFLSKVGQRGGTAAARKMTKAQRAARAKAAAAASAKVRSKKAAVRRRNAKKQKK